MNIQQKQFTYIGIGCLAISCLSYFFQQYHKQRNLYRQKKVQVKQICKKYYGEQYKKLLKQQKIRYTLDKYQGNNFRRNQSEINELILELHQIEYLTNIKNSLKQNGTKKQILLPYILIPMSQKKDIYQRFYGNISPSEIQALRLKPFQQQQTGGRFKLSAYHLDLGRIDVKVEMNNCNIFRKCLQQKIEPNIIFQQNIKKTTNSYNLTYNLMKMLSMSIYGSISYSITNQCFVVDPQFILYPTSPSNFDDVIDIITTYWEQKQKNAHLKKILIGAFAGAAFYFFIYRGIKSLWKRYFQKKQNIVNNQVDYFISKSHFQARKESKLICQRCNKKNVSIIYQCGHLCLCQDCHAINEENICPICHKKSTKEVRIFL